MLHQPSWSPWEMKERERKSMSGAIFTEWHTVLGWGRVLWKTVKNLIPGFFHKRFNLIEQKQASFALIWSLGRGIAPFYFHAMSKRTKPADPPSMLYCTLLIPCTSVEVRLFSLLMLSLTSWNTCWKHCDIHKLVQYSEKVSFFLQKYSHISKRCYVDLYQSILVQAHLGYKSHC